MKQYHEILEQIASQGSRKGDRTGTGTTSWFGQHKRFDLHHKFQPRLPVVTTKKIHLQSIEHELFWMLAGDTRLEYLIENGVRIWNEWVKSGTEVWRDLTFDELHTYLDKHWAVTATFANSDTPYSMTWPEEGEKYLQISLDAYREATTTSDIELLGSGRGNELNYEHLRRIYRVVEGKEPQVLIGGDLGPVYGKTWRDIDDVRIVPKLDWPTYEERKFDFVIDIPGEDYTKDRCVIQRKVDQVAEVLHLLEKEPDSRRIIICAWDPRLVEDQALPPCHAFIQFWTRELTLQERLDVLNAQAEIMEEKEREEGIVWRGTPRPTTVEQFIKYLELWRKEPVTEKDLGIKFDDLGVSKRAISCQLYQRSCDVFLGVPFNITFYSLLTHMLANQFNMVAEEFIWTGGDTHIYSNHETQVETQLVRECYGMPTIAFKPESKGKHILDINRDDYTIDNYKFHPHIAGKVAV